MPKTASGRKAGDPAAGKKIVLTTLGSLGDLHPYMALAIELKSRGRRPVIATSETYRDKVEGAGIEFHACRPDLVGYADAGELARLVMDIKNGPEYVVRQFVLPALRQSYDDLSVAAEGADLLVTHPLTFAGPLLAEKLGLRWAATALAPMGLFSAYDPPVIPAAPLFSRLASISPVFGRALIRIGKSRTRPWMAPIDELRADLGLPPGRHALFDGQFSPRLNLALFSSMIGEAQPDWPRNTMTTGFCFYDRDRTGAIPPALTEFLKNGPAPIVFTLGSAAVMAAGDFYKVSAAAAKMLDRRAILLVGPGESNRPTFPLPKNVVAFDYAPYSEIFPYASAIVHQGGIGTTGQAMRSGRPMLVVPFSHDQPDNAARIARLGIGTVVPRLEYKPERVARELDGLIRNVRYAQQAGAVSWTIQEEAGPQTACDALERLL